jgi:hypothetical protein
MRHGRARTVVERAVTAWVCLALAVGAVALVWLALVVVLLVAGRREEARALAGFIPDCLVLTARLMSDPRVPRRRKLLLAGLVREHWPGPEQSLAVVLRVARL